MKTTSLKIGIDEAGRGPWAGPVYAAIVVLNEDQEELLKAAGVKDSKKISEKKREEFYELIKSNSLLYYVTSLNVEDIDKLGIYKATIKLIEKLVSETAFTKCSFKYDSDLILIDGSFPPLSLIENSTNRKISYNCIIDGDVTECCIAAASILAKVERDRKMLELHKSFPNYGFDKHKGYGTKLHKENLIKYGPCPHHRKSFKPIKNLFNT